MRKLIVAVAVLCLMSGVSMAGMQSGQVEIGGAVMVMKPTTEGDLTGTAMGGIGYMLTDNIELKGQASLTITGGDVSGTLGGGLEFYLTPSASMVPYIGASAMTSIGEYGGGEGLLIDVHGGVKQFISENTSVNLTLYYETTTDNFTDGGMLIGMLGLSVYL